MRAKSAVLFLLAASLFISAFACADDSSNEGRLKFSFDSLPFIGGSDKEGDAEPERAVPEREEGEYTYDAMGRKVPVRTR